MTEAEPLDGPLPDAVRERVLTLAADTVVSLPPEEVPARLVSVARFAPRLRVRRGAGPLSAVLESDAAFRSRVAEHARSTTPELAAELEAGRVPATADPVEAAAVAYVLRAPGWPERVAAAGAALDATTSAARAAQQELTRLREQLDATRAQGRQALATAREQTEKAQAEARSLRSAVADARRAAAASDAASREATAAAEAAQAEADRRVAAADSELRRVRDRLAEAEQGLEAARRAVRTGRSAADVRLRLLLDTLVESATGLRRELALPPVSPGERPADAVAEALDHGAPAEAPTVPARARRADDPAVLDGLLVLPQVHLVVDGYNVTKTGYGSLPLDAQRQRLVTGLAALAAQTSAEVTCVFDGAALDHPVPVSSRRGVRVMFSPAGTTADQVVRRLVRAEPEGRAVVVVSSDREVVEGVVAAGAHAVPSTALLRRLDRG